MANVTIARKQRILAVKESTRGTLEFPASDGSTQEIIAAGYGNMSQTPSYTDSEEIRDTLDVLERFTDRKPAGSWSFPMYARPSGSLGSEPMGDVIFESFMGSKTVNSSTDVRYTQSTEKPSFSLWMRVGEQVFFAKGCVCNSMSPTVDNTGGVELGPEGQLMLLGWVGTDTVSGDTSADNTITVNNPKRFSVGGRIQNITTGEDNSGSGYEITAVDVSTGEITLGSSLSTAWSTDDVIEPFLPSGTEVGIPIASRKTTADVGSETDKLLQSIDLSLNQGVQMLEDEMSTVGHPQDYIPTGRDLTGTLNMYFRNKDLAYFHDGFQGEQVPVTIKFGDEGGYKLDLSLPQASLEVPEKSTNAPAVNLGVGFRALGNSGEDSMELIFK